MIRTPISQRIVRASGLEVAIAQEVHTAVTHPHQDNAKRIVDNIVCTFAGKLSTRAVPQRCGACPSTWSSATPASPPPATPSTADIGIRGGRIAQLGAGLPAAQREIDAAGRVVTPGGVDAHCHLDQPMAAAAAHGRRLRQRHALGGLRRHHHRDPLRRAGEGPVAARRRGRLPRAAPKASAHVDYAFHLIVSDPTPQVLNEELPALIARGLHLVQGLHDLRRPEARRRPDPRRAGRRARSMARWR